MKTLLYAAAVCMTVFLACGGSHPVCVAIACVQGASWDSNSCSCVFPTDMGADCSSNCGGGTAGCPSACSPGCSGGKLCCPYSGGACLVTDAGTCANNGGFSCATPTAAGVCPNQCYP